MPGHYDKGIKTPTQLNIPLLQTSTSGTGKCFIKVENCLSKMNSRLYRQGRTYDVSFSAVSTGGSDSALTRIDFFTLPNSWFVYGAIKDAFNTYMEMHREELAAGLKFSKWHDFMINEQNPDATWDYSAPALYDGDGWAAVVGDEDISDSTVTNAAGTSVGFHIMGNIANSYNIFREYAQRLKYGHPADESVASDQPYDGLLALDDAENMSEKGDQAPYDRDFSTFLPADAVVDDDSSTNLMCLQDSLEFHKDVGSGGRLNTRTFRAPLGMVWVQKYAAGAANMSTTVPELLLRASPGSYKGVKSHSLTG